MHRPRRRATRRRRNRTYQATGYVALPVLKTRMKAPRCSCSRGGREAKGKSAPHSGTLIGMGHGPASGITRI